MASKTGYFDVVFSPVATTRRENGGLAGGIARLAAFGAIIGVVMGLLAAAAVAVVGAVATAFFPLAFLLAGVGVAAALLSIIALAICLAVAMIVHDVVLTAVLFVCAKLLGGKGDFSKHFYLNALITTTYPIIAVIAFTVAVILLFIPVFGPAIFAVAVACIALYCLYLRSLAVKQTHGLGWGKSVFAVLLVPIILAAFLLAGLVAALV
ncbi:hypothetical protein H0O03_03570 [Candidatus Micrarchaeota archaeon]|nr:hypothetical protein [Candidatus Micrarchaeota archaeon]